MQNNKSLFLSKLDHICNLLGKPKWNKGRERALIELTGQNRTTIVNWKFKNTLPKQSNRLTISDNIGVSYSYLYDDNVSIGDIGPPETYELQEYLSVPYINPKFFKKYRNNLIFPIEQRLKLLKYSETITKNSNKIYAYNIEINNVKTNQNTKYTIFYTYTDKLIPGELILDTRNNNNKIFINENTRSINNEEIFKIISITL